MPCGITHDTMCGSYVRRQDRQRDRHRWLPLVDGCEGPCVVATAPYIYVAPPFCMHAHTPLCVVSARGLVVACRGSDFSALPGAVAHFCGACSMMCVSTRVCVMWSVCPLLSAASLLECVLMTADRGFTLL